MITLGRVVVFLVAVLAVRGKKSASTKTFLGPLARRAHENEFPHQVSIQVDGSHTCGGSLISYQHVLTAAHCVHTMIISPETTFVKGIRMTVEVGSTGLGQGIKRRIKRISHISSYSRWDGTWDGSFTLNDIAVITLSTPVTPSPNVKLINLPAAMSEIPEKSEMLISGFGISRKNGNTSSFLRVSPMETVSQKDCDVFYGNYSGVRIRSSHLCAKQIRGFGICPGDSGGALINGTTVYGVASGIAEICALGYPDVFTKVSHFINYINYEMRYPALWGNSLARAVNIPNLPDYLPTSWDNPWLYDVQFADLKNDHENELEIVTSREPMEKYIDASTGMYVFPQSKYPPYEPLYPLFFIKPKY